MLSGYACENVFDEYDNTGRFPYIWGNNSSGSRTLDQFNYWRLTADYNQTYNYGSATSRSVIIDMGEPVKILDVAEFLIARSGKEIAIEFTGLREGEKLHEVLSGIDEDSEIRKHSLISHLRVEPIANIDEARYIFENRIY